MGFGFNVGFGTTSNSRTMPPVVRRADTTAFVSTPRGPLQSQHLIDQNSGSGASTPRSARDSHVAETYGECAVCFDPLCAQRTAVLTQEHGRGMRKERTRSCAHFFHLACANELRVHHAKCPICRAPFNGVLPVPSPGEDPDGWFAAVDVDGDGRLSPSEVLEALRAQIRCDWHAIERQLPKLWRRWDINGDGYVEKNELVSRGGLIEYVTKHFPKREHRERPPPPSIARAPNEWFEYWDEDGSGELEKEEVVRALVKTFGLGADMPSLRHYHHALVFVCVAIVSGGYVAAFSAVAGCASDPESIHAELPNRDAIHVSAPGNAPTRSSARVDAIRPSWVTYSSSDDALRERLAPHRPHPLASSVGRPL